METEALITELEKPRKNYPQGVLAWEAGDEVLYKGAASEGTHKGLVVEKFCNVLKIMWPDGETVRIRVVHCTHSADDPRLLGRVLRELVKGRYHISVNYDFKGFNKVSVIGPFSDSIELHLTAWVPIENHYEGDTLLEAALKALLEKMGEI